MSRDWSKAFVRASFKGVEFWVRHESGSGGRRVHVQHAAYGETPVTEDFGQREFVYPSHIYVAGDTADADMLSLVAAFRSRGPGRLVLPWQSPVVAHCLEFQAGRAKDQNGLITCKVHFIEAGGLGSRTGGFGGVGVLAVNAAIASFRSLSLSASARL